MLDNDEPERFGRYVLVRRFRKGGMGALALALDTENGRQVVIKRLAAGGSQDDKAARFSDEITLSLKLSHPNLARAVDSGTIDGVQYLALEWIAGQDLATLDERARRFGQRVSHGVAAGIVRQMCSAFEYAHAQAGFVHRDVSPNNIMLGYDGIARLIDYGAALSAWKTSKTIPGMVLGTAGHLSPEQRQGKPADARSDLFSLGTIMWFLLTGLPYYGQGEDGNSKAVLLEHFKVQGGDVPAPLFTFMWRALQRSPNHRYESAAEMGAELERAIKPATTAEAAQFICELFPVERKVDADDAAEWHAKYVPVRATTQEPRKEGNQEGAPATIERTAVIDSGEPRPGRRETLVLDRVPRSRTPFVVLLVLGTAALAVLAVYVQHQAKRKPAPAPAPMRPIVVEPAPTPPHPVPVDPPPAPAPPAPVEPVAPVLVEPSHPAPLAPLLRRVHEARAMADRGQSSKARELLTELEKDARLRVPVRIALADVEYTEGHYDAAIKIASQAARDGGGVEAIAMRAAAELKAGRAKEAIRDFDRVLAVQPNNDDAREGKKAAQKLLEGTK